MADVVVTLVLTTEDPDMSGVVEAAVAEAEAEGHTVTEARVTTDAGEQVVEVPTPEEPSPEPTPTSPPDSSTDPPKKGK